MIKLQSDYDNWKIAPEGIMNCKNCFLNILKLSELRIFWPSFPITMEGKNEFFRSYILYFTLDKRTFAVLALYVFTETGIILNKNFEHWNITFLKKKHSFLYYLLFSSVSKLSSYRCPANTARC